MVSEEIRRIREAEKEAEEKVRLARAEAKRILGEAQEAAERVLEEARRGAREEEAKLVERVTVEAESDATKLVDESKLAVEEARKAGEGRIDAGVKRVLEAVSE